MNASKNDLQAEKDQLDARLNALREASKNEGAFRALGNEQQGLLIQQQNAMAQYSAALGQRIENYVEPPADQKQEEPQDVDQPLGRKEGSKTLAHKAEARADARHRK